jgi:hypothetical protein
MLKGDEDAGAWKEELEKAVAAGYNDKDSETALKALPKLTAADKAEVERILGETAEAAQKELQAAAKTETGKPAGEEKTDEKQKSAADSTAAPAAADNTAAPAPAAKQ